MFKTHHRTELSLTAWSWLAALLIMSGCACLTTPPMTPELVPAEPVVPIAETQTPVPAEPTTGDIVKIKIETTQGDIEADLYAKETPKTVENFVTLAKKGFYDGIIFHRVIPNFMIQTGDPTGTGRGGPGYQFNDEFSPNLSHDQAGVISMANAGPNTNGSQFFITDAPTPWLNNHHSVFGRVTKGIEVVHAIANAPRNAQDKPLAEIKMKKVTVLG